MKTIYLDHAATSPMHPDVASEMMEVMTSVHGNPSSIHSFGRVARHQVDQARAVIASSIGAKEQEIIFTSGGTESDNLAIFGVAKALANKGRHLITTEVEHHAVLHAFEALEKEGFTVTYLPVNDEGRISIDQLKQALTEQTTLVSVMYGNNEVGTIQPIEEIGELLKDRDVYFHTDAVQAYGVEALNVNALQVDLLSTSSHKINGPKGIGFLYVREGTPLAVQQFGGEQERKRRAGTENVASITGFKRAVEIAQSTMEDKRSQYELLKKTFLDVLTEAEVDFKRNGSLEHSLPHVLNLSIPGAHVESLLVNLDLAGVAVSSGSACTAGSIDPSHVLVAMYGKYADELTNSVRFSFGFSTTEEEVEEAAKRLVNIIERWKK